MRFFVLSDFVRFGEPNVFWLTFVEKDIQC